MTDDNDQDAEQSEVATGEYDWNAVSPTTAVVELVAEVQNVEVRELDSLYGYVDPDALEAMLLKDAGTDVGVVVRFVFENYVVRLGSDGSLALLE